MNYNPDPVADQLRLNEAITRAKLRQHTLPEIDVVNPSKSVDQYVKELIHLQHQFRIGDFDEQIEDTF